MIQSFIRPFAGVYLIVNLVNGNMYVGSAIASRMPNRFHKHLYGGSGSALVDAAVQKYGLDQFAFILLGTLSPFTSAPESFALWGKGNAELLDLENFYLQLLTPVYNLAPQAGNTYGMQHTAETKALMSANYSKSRREAIGSLNRGKTFSPVTIQRMTDAALARGPMPSETKELVSLNSAKAQLFEISLLDGSLLKDGSTASLPPLVGLLYYVLSL